MHANNIILLLFVVTTSVFSQSIYNGDFEINDYTSCGFYSVDSQFNKSIYKVTSFSGLGAGLDDSSCHGKPYSGKWFITLGAVTYHKSQKISLEITDTLLSGRSYNLSFYVSGGTLINTPYSIMKIWAGVSEQWYILGDSLYEGYPITDQWDNVNLNFVVPNNKKYKYITFTVDSTVYGWNRLDKVELSLVTALQLLTINEPKMTIYPNPFNHSIQIQQAQGYAFSLYNYSGINIINKKIITANDEIETDQLPAGIYFYRLSDGTEIKTGKLIKE